MYKEVMTPKYNVKEIKEINDPDFVSWLCPLELIAVERSEKEYKGEKYLANVSIVKTNDGEYYKIANGKIAYKKYLYFLCAFGDQIGKKYNLVSTDDGHKWTLHIE